MGITEFVLLTDLLHVNYTIPLSYDSMNLRGTNITETLKICLFFEFGPTWNFSKVVWYRSHERFQISGNNHDELCSIYKTATLYSYGIIVFTRWSSALTPFYSGFISKLQILHKERNPWSFDSIIVFKKIGQSLFYKKACPHRFEIRLESYNYGKLSFQFPGIIYADVLHDTWCFCQYTERLLKKSSFTNL